MMLVMIAGTPLLLKPTVAGASKRKLLLRFDLDSTAVRRPFDYISKVIEFTVT